MAKISHSFPDHNQNFWQLTCIQSAAQSIPSIIMGGIIAQKFGVNAAISSIFIGNLIAWLIGLSIISMAAKERKNAVENTKEYLGKSGSLLMSMTLLIAFFSWYVLEIQAATLSLTPFLTMHTGFSPVLLGTISGVVIAFISIGGIRLIKWIAVSAFPLIFFFWLYSIFSSDNLTFEGSWELSLSAIFIITSLSLPGMVNLPTFFRHSKSQADSLLALTLITIFDMLFQLFSVFTKITTPSEILTKLQLTQNGNFQIALTLAFIILSLLCLNLVNIYYSSAALQELNKKFAGPKSYLFVGLIGTILYTLSQNFPFMQFLENMTNNFIANIGVVLILSFLVSIIVKHRPKFLEKTMGFSCCAFGCVLALTAQIIDPEAPDRALVFGFGGATLAFLLILFFEETSWAVKKIYK
jgi:cytosine permease